MNAKHFLSTANTDLYLKPWQQKKKRVHLSSYFPKTLPEGGLGFSIAVSAPDRTPLNTDGATFPMRSHSTMTSYVLLLTSPFSPNFPRAPFRSSSLTTGRFFFLTSGWDILFGGGGGVVSGQWRLDFLCTLSSCLLYPVTRTDLTPPSLYIISSALSVRSGCPLSLRDYYKQLNTL